MDDGSNIKSTKYESNKDLGFIEKINSVEMKLVRKEKSLREI